MSEQQIHARFDEFAAAWNAHDPEAMARCFVEYGNVTHPWGTFAAGREAIVRLLARDHVDGPMRESRMRFDGITIRHLSDHAAVVECNGEIEDVLAPNGTRYELPHRINAVVVNEDGWRFLSLNPNIIARA